MFNGLILNIKIFKKVRVIADYKCFDASFKNQTQYSQQRLLNKNYLAWDSLVQLHPNI